jgi:hypothetical protein
MTAGLPKVTVLESQGLRQSAGGLFLFASELERAKPLKDGDAKPRV